MSNHVLVFNEPTCMGCGLPVTSCTCNQSATHNAQRLTPVVPFQEEKGEVISADRCSKGLTRQYLPGDLPADFTGAAGGSQQATELKPKLTSMGLPGEY